MGGISCGLELWQLIAVPYLYSSIECFVDIPKETIKKLNDLHILFLRCLLNTGRGTPIGAMFWFVGHFLPTNIIMRKTLMFYFHVMNLETGSIAREVALKQQRLGFDGLVSHARRYLAELGLRETLTTCTTKAQFSRIITEKIRAKNAQDILVMCKGYKKINYFDMKKETFGLNELCKSMTLSDSRNLFAIKYCMNRTSQLNFASDPLFSKQSYLCHCGQISSNLHFRYCISYESLRIGRDLSEDTQLIKYYVEVNKLRDKMEREIST